jgi:radical SAM superfamily enzyme YgiQ (UPF0313 family)
MTGEGDFRPREPEDVIAEMQYLIQYHGITHFQFSDELFMSSTERVGRFCEELLVAFSGRIKWDCNGRLNFAKPKVLEIMKESGCQYVNYGIESLDPIVLKNLRKGLTINQIETGVENTLRAGLTPGLNIIWGSPGDTPTSLEKAVSFLLKHDTCSELRTIRPVTPYPGSQLYTEAINKGLIKDAADFYENRHVNSDLLTCNFTDIPDKEFHELLFKANEKLVRNYYSKNLTKTIRQASDMYRGKNNNFRGFRAI